jgi:hypothetical protein
MFYFNQFDLKGVCVNEIKNPMMSVTLNRKGDIPPNTSANSGNYYKYVSPEPPNAYDMYMKSAKIQQQQQQQSSAPATSATDHQSHVSSATPNLENSNYFVSTEHPSPAATNVSSEVTRRKKFDKDPASVRMVWNGVQDDTPPPHKTRVEPTYGNYFQYQPHQQQQQQHQQQQQTHHNLRQRADYARMILMNSPYDRQQQQQDLLRFKSNLFRAKSTDVELNRPPTSALIASDESTYRPYYLSGAGAAVSPNNFSNNYNANYMYQPAIILPSGQHPYFGEIILFVFFLKF